MYSARQLFSNHDSAIATQQDTKIMLYTKPNGIIALCLLLICFFLVTTSIAGKPNKETTLKRRSITNKLNLKELLVYIENPNYSQLFEVEDEVTNLNSPKTNIDYSRTILKTKFITADILKKLEPTLYNGCVVKEGVEDQSNAINVLLIRLERNYTKNINSSKLKMLSIDRINIINTMSTSYNEKNQNDRAQALDKFVYDMQEHWIKVSKLKTPKKQSPNGLSDNKTSADSDYKLLSINSSNSKLASTSSESIASIKTPSSSKLASTSSDNSTPIKTPSSLEKFKQIEKESKQKQFLTPSSYISTITEFEPDTFNDKTGRLNCEKALRYVQEILGDSYKSIQSFKEDNARLYERCRNGSTTSQEATISKITYNFEKIEKNQIKEYKLKYYQNERKIIIDLGMNRIKAAHGKNDKEQMIDEYLRSLQGLYTRIKDSKTPTSNKTTLPNTLCCRCIRLICCNKSTTKKTPKNTPLLSEQHTQYQSTLPATIDMT